MFSVHVSHFILSFYDVLRALSIALFCYASDTDQVIDLPYMLQKE